MSVRKIEELKKSKQFSNISTKNPIPQHHTKFNDSKEELDIKIHPKANIYASREEFAMLREELILLRQEVQELKNRNNKHTFTEERQPEALRPKAPRPKEVAPRRALPKQPPPRGDHHGWRPSGEPATLNIR